MTGAVPNKLIRWHELLFYGLLGMPLAMLGIPLYLFLPNFYNTHFELSLTVIGLALLFARLFDVISDPLIGIISDHFAARLDRSRQMAIGALVLWCGLFFLFIPDNRINLFLGTEISSAYLFLWSFLTYLGWSWVQIPYMAMAAELTCNHHQKTRISGSRELFSMLGVIWVMSLPTIMGVLANSTIFYRTLFELLSLLLLVGVLFVFLLKHPGSKPSAEPETSLINAIKRMLGRLRQLRKHSPQTFSLMPGYFLNNLANAIPATLFILFVSHYLQLEEQTGVFLILYFLSGILALPLWIALSRKFGKKQVWQSSIMLAGISFVGVFFIASGDFWGFAIICLLTGLSLGVDLAIPASMQADLIQQSALSAEAEKTETSGAGMIFGIWGFLTKFSLALAIGIIFPLLDLSQWLADNYLPGRIEDLEQITLIALYAAVPILLKLWAWQKIRKLN